MNMFEKMSPPSLRTDSQEFRLRHWLRMYQNWSRVVTKCIIKNSRMFWSQGYLKWKVWRGYESACAKIFA